MYIFIPIASGKNIGLFRFAQQVKWVKNPCSKMNLKGTDNDEPNPSEVLSEA